MATSSGPDLQNGFFLDSSGTYFLDKKFFVDLLILKFNLSVPEPLLVEINLPAPLSLIP